MEETSPTEALVIAGVVVALTVAIIWIVNARLRRTWRAAAAATGLPLVKKARIEATLPGGRLVALAGDRMVDMGPDYPHQAITSVFGTLDLQPPEFFVASTDGSPAGGPTFTTGDAEFDALVVVGAKDMEAGRAYLTPRRRRALLRFFTTVPRGCLSSGAIGRSRDGRMGARELTMTIQAVKDVLEGLAGDGPASRARG